MLVVAHLPPSWLLGATVFVLFCVLCSLFHQLFLSCFLSSFLFHLHRALPLSDSRSLALQWQRTYTHTYPAESFIIVDLAMNWSSFAFTFCTWVNFNALLPSFLDFFLSFFLFLLFYFLFSFLNYSSFCFFIILTETIVCSFITNFTATTCLKLYFPTYFKNCNCSQACQISMTNSVSRKCLAQRGKPVCLSMCVKTKLLDD